MVNCVCRTSHRRLFSLLIAVFLSSLMLAVYLCVYLFAYNDDVVFPRRSLHTNITIPTNSLSTSFPTISSLTTVQTSSVLSGNSVNTLLTTDVLKSNFKVMVDGKVPERVVIPEGGNIHFSVRTSSKNYQKRLPLVFLTWIQTVPPKNIHIVSDKKDSAKWIEYSSAYGFHFEATSCLTQHSRVALGCKTGVGLELYYEELEAGNGLEWYCHVDDDIYVNVPILTQILQNFTAESKVYIGPECGREMPITAKVKRTMDLKRPFYDFVCGAFYCINKSLMKDLESYLRGQKLNSVCKQGFNDDMAVGFLVNAVLGIDVLFSNLMLTHIDVMTHIPLDDLKSVASVSYGDFFQQRDWKKPITNNFITENHILIPNATFTEEEDPSRFLAYHCLLYPNTSWCDRGSN